MHCSDQKYYVVKFPAFVRWGVTLIVLVIGVTLGIVLAWATELAKDDYKAWLFGVALGIFALPFAIRAAVFAAYKGLPTILAFQGITIFELILGLGLIIEIVVCFRAPKWFP